eukprot:Hpha_TRINITY_DN3172_c0_g1::TRINITY_DN3172_c0_g1_i1::g.96513::m.96513
MFAAMGAQRAADPSPVGRTASAPRPSPKSPGVSRPSPAVKGFSPRPLSPADPASHKSPSQPRLAERQSAPTPPGFANGKSPPPSTVKYPPPRPLEGPVKVSQTPSFAGTSPDLARENSRAIRPPSSAVKSPRQPPSRAAEAAHPPPQHPPAQEHFRSSEPPRHTTVPQLPPYPEAPYPQHLAGSAATFDAYDRAPEDKGPAVGPDTDVASGQEAAWEWARRSFAPQEHLVRGSLLVDGVNYAIFEGLRGRGSHLVDNVETAIKDDFVSAVGHGIRRKDVDTRILPGVITSVVLEYDDQEQEERDSNERGVTSPRLVDAQWGIKLDYVLRLRDAETQHAAAKTLFWALQREDGVSLEEMAGAYRQMLPHDADPPVLRVRPGAGVPPEASVPKQRSAMSPPAPAPP